MTRPFCAFVNDITSLQNCCKVGKHLLLSDPFALSARIFSAGVPFPKNFMTIAKTILKRLFRVYAHVYHQHFADIRYLKEEAHLNTSFKHFVFFVQEFNLIDKRELAPLQDLIDKLLAKG